MELTVQADDGDVLHLQVRGPIAMTVPGEQADSIPKLLDDRGYARRVLLNMDKAESIDSGGLSWLLVSHKRFCDAGGKLVVHSIPVSVMEVFRMMRLELVLALAEDESSALAMVLGDES